MSVLFTLMVPAVIIPLVGLGVDATMLYIVQAKLAAAADGAALGSGRLLGSPADPSEIAGEFLRANFRTDGTAGFWGATNLQPNVNVTLGVTKTIVINATADVPLLFARIFGRATARVAARATATKKDTRLVLVIDRSGSMNRSDGSGSTVIADLVSYAQGFTQKFTGGSDELGLIAFDGSAVVGYPTPRPWSPTVTNTGGPDTSFESGSSTDMVHQIAAITANQGTGTAEALWLAYIELQKAHLRDLARDGSDLRQNAIVLFTDGVPSAISLYMNNPANSNANNIIKSTSGCTYKTITAGTQEDSAHMMLSWVTLPGSPPYSTSGLGLWGMYQLASIDPTSSRTAAWYMANGGGDATVPNPSTPYNGCTGLTNAGPNSNFTTYVSKIPSIDRYGNSTTGTGYRDSHIIGGSTSSVYNGTDLNLNSSNIDYHWGLAIWNSVDNTANAIRNDVNLANRAGDTQNMAIQIYSIGYTGTGGCDDGLLKRVSNDTSSTSFNALQPRGRYITASDSVGLANAFAQVASSMLRLSQ
jgi:hypothetical protein